MGAPSNRTATLESQMIPMIQDVPGQTLRPWFFSTKTRAHEEHTKSDRQGLNNENLPRLFRTAADSSAIIGGASVLLRHSCLTLWATRLHKGHGGSISSTAP